MFPTKSPFLISLYIPTISNQLFNLKVKNTARSTCTATVDNLLTGQLETGLHHIKIWLAKPVSH